MRTNLPPGLSTLTTYRSGAGVEVAVERKQTNGKSYYSVWLLVLVRECYNFMYSKGGEAGFWRALNTI